MRGMAGVFQWRNLRTSVLMHNTQQLIRSTSAPLWSLSVAPSQRSDSSISPTVIAILARESPGVVSTRLRSVGVMCRRRCRQGRRQASGSSEIDPTTIRSSQDTETGRSSALRPFPLSVPALLSIRALRAAQPPLDLRTFQVDASPHAQDTALGKPPGLDPLVHGFRADPEVIGKLLNLHHECFLHEIAPFYEHRCIEYVGTVGSSIGRSSRARSSPIRT